MEFRDYYQTLGVARDAPADDIKKAFRKLARKYHPDVSREPDAAKRMAQINEANTVLSDPEKRAAYDQLGPRRVQAAFSLVAAAGFAVFALSEGLAGFAVARLILGVGVSAGLMAILKANTQWFAPVQVAGVTGMAMAVGSLGSVLTTAPVQAALPMLGWRGVFWLLCGLSLAVAVWIFVSVRDKPGHAARRGLKAELARRQRKLHRQHRADDRHHGARGLVEEVQRRQRQGDPEEQGGSGVHARR